MKSRFSLYLLSVFISFSLMTRAMDEKKDDLPIQELQRIAEIAFPAPVYNCDSHPDDKGKWESANKAIAIQGSLIFTLPIDLFPHSIFPYLDSQMFLRLGATCHFFNELSQLSFFYLNNYWAAL